MNAASGIDPKRLTRRAPALAVFLSIFMVELLSQHAPRVGRWVSSSFQPSR